MGRSATLLIVDDDDRNVRILIEIFGDKYSVISANCGELALSKAAEYRPDIILLDIMMPDIGGLEVCRKIRLNPKLRLTKIILVTGKARIEDRLEGYKAGADDYIVKPFDIDEIMAKVAVYEKLKAVEEVDNLKNSFLSLISDETGAPLNAIVSLSSLLLSEKSLNERDRGYVGQIKQAAIEHVEKIQRMLLLSMLQGQDIIADDVIYSQDILSSVLLMLSKNIADNEINIEQTIIDEIELSGNYELLQKALFYIIENSIKFSPHAGTVKITQLIENEHILFKVEDSGEGIDMDAFGGLFDSFSISDIEHHGAGIGVSLALSYMIIEGHGGKLTASNNDSGGAVFTLYLPLTKKGAG